MTLYDYTKRCLEENGKTFDDIIWIGNKIIQIDRDVGLVRSIASAEAEKFTGRNKPQIIPFQNRQKTANMNRQSNAVSL